MMSALGFITCCVSVAHADDALSLLQRHAVQRMSVRGPNPSGIPAGCQPEMVAENKKCRGTLGGAGGVRKADNIWGFNNGSMVPHAFNGVNGYNNGWSNDGIVGAWASTIRTLPGCCGTRFTVCDTANNGNWQVYCPTAHAHEAGNVDGLCTEFEDAANCWVYDGATASCGTEDLKGKDTCSLHEYQIKDGCTPKLVKEQSVCTKSDGGGTHGQARTIVARVSSVEQCMERWTNHASCCGARVDWDPLTGECGCADRLRGDNDVPWFCQDGVGVQPGPITGPYQTHYMMRTNCPNPPLPCGAAESPGGTWVTPAAGTAQPAVYDIGHCLHPHLHDCPVAPGDFKPDPCAAVVSGVLNQPTYSNLAGQGPDSDMPDGILYPDALTTGGNIYDLKITSPGFVSSKSSKNGASGGLGTFNVKCGTEAEVTAVLVDKNGQPATIDATLAITFLDLDEGKRGKGRTTVSSCQANSMTAGSELTTTEENGCKVATSTKFGTAANNPLSLAEIEDDHKLRAATFMFDAAAEYKFTIGLSAGKKGRMVMFVLTPVLGCKE